ncbi:MAG: glycosyltransferase [Ignavibacteria bacterium]|nr:glycosyltransferase [Ignavibacteria bacterium]
MSTEHHRSGDADKDRDSVILPVSLVLTTRNEANTVEAFLRSVGEQTVLPAEVVLCDGGSTDGTADIARSTEVPGVDVVVIEKPGSNIAAGRNGAIAAARQDIVAVSDAGSLLPPDWLERITAPLLRDAGVDVVGGGYGYITDTRFERIAAAAEMDVRDLDPATFLPSSRSFAFRVAAWRAVGGYPEDLTFAGEDTAFCLALKQAGFRMALDLEARVRWRPRPRLSAYMRQQYLYGIGDGEARNKAPFYLKIILKHGLLVAFCLAGIWFWPLLVVALAASAWYTLRMRRLYRWSAQPASVWLPAFALVAVKEWSALAGFLAGSLRPSRGRRAHAG